MNIKYYRLAKDEEPPEEFCAVRDVGGEPSEYVFYVPESEVAKLRELCSGLAQVVKNDDDTFRRLREIAKKELSCDFIGMYDSSLGKIDQIVRFIDSMAELGIEVPS